MRDRKWVWFCLFYIGVCLGTSLYGYPINRSFRAIDSVYMFAYKQHFSKHYKGWEVVYTEFNADTDDFILPLCFSIGNKKAKKKSKKYLSSKNYTWSIGFDGYQRLSRDFYLHLGLGGFLGVELNTLQVTQSDTKKITYFLTGIAPKIGATFLEYSALGIAIGVTVFSEFSNSRVSSSNFGCDVSLGIHF